MSEFSDTLTGLLRSRLFQLLGECQFVSTAGERLAAVHSIAGSLAGEIDAIRQSASPLRWSQRTITEWQNTTFGEPRSNLSIAIRASEEMAKLLRCLVNDDNDPAARTEVADIVIVLCRLVERLGGNMAGDVAAKMEVNLKRVWKRRGGGHGQHVRDEQPSKPTQRMTDAELIRELRTRGLVHVNDF